VDRPAIVAPVSRLLAAEDVARSLAFYRDVVGFEARSVREEDGIPVYADLVYGPARIEIGVGDGAIDTTFDRRPRGAAILFFQSADVDAMHAAVRARGGRPTDPERVNWIKMRMFQLRDPDGHTLWFGESYHEESGGDTYAEARVPAGRGQLRQVMPELPLDDVPAGVSYYRDVLGFSVNYQQHDLGVMDRDEVRVLLVARTERHTGIGSACVYVADADALHAELSAKGALVQGEPVSHPWGLRVFDVLDPEGNRITFAQTFE
jgi:predicted enzyme related to lactoylglutathione lyase